MAVEGFGMSEIPNRPLTAMSSVKTTEALSDLFVAKNCRYCPEEKTRGVPLCGNINTWRGAIMKLPGIVVEGGLSQFCAFGCGGPFGSLGSSVTSDQVSVRFRMMKLVTIVFPTW